MTAQRRLLVAVAICLFLTGCGEAPAGDAAQSTSRPQRAGQETSPLVTVRHVVASEVASLRGNQGAARDHVQAMHKNMMRDMRLADTSRAISPEAARAAVRSLQGVKSSVWIDRSNLLVMVDGSQYRSMSTIDRVCDAVEPMGDSLAVVVNVQDVMATTSEGADTLSRNCQLGEGERAMFQQKRQVDVLDPELRQQFQGQQSK